MLSMVICWPRKYTRGDLRRLAEGLNNEKKRTAKDDCSMKHKNVFGTVGNETATRVSETKKTTDCRAGSGSALIEGFGVELDRAQRL